MRWAEELGIHRRLLYKWRDRLEPVEQGELPAANLRERELQQQVARLKHLVADKTLEADFFKGALQKVEGSTPEQRRLWRDGIYEQIRELMPMQGGLSIEQMCRLSGVSWAGSIAACKSACRWKKQWRCARRFSRSPWSIGGAMATAGLRPSCGGAAW